VKNSLRRSFFVESITGNPKYASEKPAAWKGLVKWAAALVVLGLLLLLVFHGSGGAGASGGSAG
jgi:hypothetical protein